MDDAKLPVYTPVPTVTDEFVDVSREQARSRKRRRVFKFSVLTLLAAFVGLSYLNDAPEHVRRYCSMSKKPTVLSDVVGHGHGLPGVDTDSVVTIDCPSWDSISDDTFEFELPIEDDTALFFVNKEQKSPYHHSHGVLPSGDIKFVVGDDDSKSDVVKVQVKAKDRVDDVVSDHVRVCTVEAESDEKKHPGKAAGVGLFTDRRIPYHTRLPFEITVTFPSSASLRKEVYIPGLVTKMPLFSHDFSGLDGKVDFGLLAVGTANAEVTADSISAQAIFIHTANGDIDGNFTAQDGFLEIATANGHIRANVTVRDSEDEEKHSRLILHTANGAIDANVTLNSYSSDSAPGVFDVSAQTAHANLNVNFVSAPVDSTLTLKAHTASASAYVKLHETYEGSFHLSTALGKAEVIENNEVEDPKGRKRTRRVGYEHKTKWATSGSVAWEDEKDLADAGQVDVRTALGDAILEL